MNRILNLQKEDDSWTTDEDEIVTEVTNYYQQLFTSVCHVDLEVILDGIPETITPQISDDLNRPIEDSEIKDSIF